MSEKKKNIPWPEARDANASRGCFGWEWYERSRVQTYLIVLHLMTSQRLVVLVFRLLTGIIQVKIQVHSKKPSNSPYHGITIMICSTSSAVVSCPSGAASSSCRWSTRRQRNTHIVRKAVSHSSRALRSLSQKKYIVRNSGKSRPCKGHLLYSGTRKKGVEGWCKEKWAEQ